MKIIGGIVSYEDGVKTTAGDQFSPTRKVRVELNFSVDEGDNAEKVLDLVLDKAQALTQRKLGIAGATAGARTKADIETEALGSGKPAAPASETKRRGPKTKAEKEAEAAAAAAEAAKQKPAADPAAMEDVTTVKPEEQKPAAEDPAAMDEFTVKPEQATVTDADLNSHVQKKNAALGNPAKIRELISKYNPDPTKQFTLREIPQAQRQDFLTNLAALA